MRVKVLLTAAGLFLLLAAAAAAQDEAVLARHPAPSPDGSTIAFSYHGDIWVAPTAGGRALRLTVHQAYDHQPKWSPDGSEIAFSSDRFGNDDVYVIPAAGGEATRLTFLSTADVVCGWTPDGERILFHSRRDFSAHRVPLIYSVPRAGGMATEFMPEFGSEGTLSPDGTWLAFTSGYRSYWWRRNYRGAGNNDIWIWNTITGEYRRLTDHPGNDAFPMWCADGTAIYYLSDADGGDNIWRVEIESGERTRITSHTDDGPRFPSISADGSLIAYELGTDLYTLRTDGGEPIRLAAVAPTDSRFNATERRTFSNNADEMEPSPDNEEIAFVVRGELFAMREEGGRTARLTSNSARDHDFVWKPDGTALVFISDREGNYDLYLVESDDPDESRLSRALAFTVTSLTDDPADEWSPRFSPDGSRLAYVRGNGDLRVIDWETREDTLLLAGWMQPDYSWSPDGRWIAYSRPDGEFNNDVWIIPAAGGEAVNITRHPDEDSSPVWSADGRKLAFVSKRLGDGGDNYDIWFVFLRLEDHERTAEEWEDLEDAEEDGANGEEEEEEEELVVEIDFEEIHLRLRRVTSMPGSETDVAISPDGETFAFASDNSGEDELWTVKWDGSELQQLTRGGADPAAIRWSSDGKKIYFLRSGGTIQSVAAGGGSPTSHSFQARMTIDHPAERLQKFEEGWRTLNARFYDPHFHGADWAALREQYRPWALAAVENRDFNDVFNMMLGHLDASHLGMRGPFGGGPSDATGMLGLRFDPDNAGPGLLVTEVLRDGPCDKEAARVRPGQYLLEIDGRPVSMATNIHALLVDTVDRQVALTVADSPDADETQRLIVRPVNTGAVSQLLYESFIRQRRDMTHRFSDDRIGYLHIQSMGMPSLQRFEHELYSEAHGREAIVIDVRNNGGGWTTDMLLAILQVRPHARTMPRDGDEWGYPQDRRPLYAYWRPLVVLCNEYSYSNAEIFPWAIKTLGRGLIIGQQTNGAVISTGARGLIDGSYVRVPFRGWYVLDSNINMERNGCPPDIVVEVQPGDEAAGIDRQLERAVQELLSQLDGEE